MMTELNESISNIPVPDRMKKLPISAKGFPVPWFVAKVDGEWDFRVVGPRKVYLAIKHDSCWLCGEKLGVYKAFVTGPMCAITRTTAEPPSHLECAQYAVKACPFLSKPNMKRNNKDLPEDSVDPAGIFITRNPGVGAIYITKDFNTFQVRRETDGTDILIRMGEPKRIEWYAEGRSATRAEVIHSIDTGLPLLTKEAEKDNSVVELNRYITRVRQYLPVEE